MSITVREYLEAAKEASESGKIDVATSYGMSHAIAEAGKTWGELAAADKTPENAQRIALEAIQNEDMFLDKAGTKELSVAYTKKLIERAGDNLPAYLDDVAKAVDGVNFELVKEGKFLEGLKGKTLDGIKKDISASAQKNITGYAGTLEKDFINTLESEENKGEQSAFKDVKVEDPKPLGMHNGTDLISLIVALIGAFLGIDLTGMLQGNQPTREQQETVARETGFSIAAEQVFNAAEKLKNGTATEQDLKTVTNFAQIDNPKQLDDAQKKELGEKILEDLPHLRTGQSTESDLAKTIQKLTIDSQAQKYAEKHENMLLSDQYTLLGMMGAIADAGKEWRDTGDKTKDKAQEIATSAIPKENIFLDQAGTKKLVEGYNITLITRARQQDRDNPLPDGRTHLEAFLEDVGNATQKIDYDKFKKGEMVNKDGSAVNMSEVTDKISQAARAHIGMTETIDKDFIHTIANNPMTFKDVVVSPPNIEPDTEKLKDKYVGNLISSKMQGISILGEFNLFGKKDAEKGQEQAPPAADKSKEEPGKDAKPEEKGSQEKSKSQTAAHDNSIVPDIVAAVGNIPQFGVIGSLATFAAMNFDDIKKFAGSMPKQEPMQELPGGNHGNELAAANAALPGQQQGNKLGK